MSWKTTGQLVKEYQWVTRATICNWIANGKLSAKKTPGGHYRIDEAEFRRVLGISEEASE